MDYVNAFVSMLNGMSPYLLLGFFIAGVLHAFVPSAIYSRYLAGTGLRSVTTAAAFGIPLPLCSCGVLPTAVALRRSGASRAASTSFLIATPQTGVDSIAATYSMMGLPFAILRPVAALVTSLLGGLAVGQERVFALDRAAERVVRGDGDAAAAGNGGADGRQQGAHQRIRFCVASEQRQWHRLPDLLQAAFRQDDDLRSYGRHDLGFLVRYRHLYLFRLRAGQNSDGFGY